MLGFLATATSTTWWAGSRLTWAQEASPVLVSTLGGDLWGIRWAYVLPACWLPGSKLWDLAGVELLPRYLHVEITMIGGEESILMDSQRQSNLSLKVSEGTETWWLGRDRKIYVGQTDTPASFWVLCRILSINNVDHNTPVHARAMDVLDPSTW